MRDCYDTCAMWSEIQNGKLRVRANSANAITSNFLCPKGALLPRWFYSRERLEQPLVRKGKKPSRDFRRASWDEALELVAQKLSETRKRYGDRAVLLYYYYGDRGFLNANFPHRLFNYINASIVDDVICDRAGEEALKDVYGTAYGMDPEELKNESLLVYWGINAAWTNLHGFIYAKKLGLELWDVDIVRTATAKRVHRFFMIKPETDVLLALGIAKVIVEEELYDAHFVKNRIKGFGEFAEYLKSLKLEYIAHQTGLGEEKIRGFAEDYAEKRGVIHIGYGFQRSVNGGEAVRAIAILPALVGKERGFIYSTRILPRDYVRGTFLRGEEGYQISQIELADYIEEGKIKFIFIYGSNPLATLPNQRKLRDAILSSEAFIALHDLFLTDTALFSDVVLPTNTFFERFDIADSYYHRYLAVNEKLMEYKGKSNVEVAKLLARKMNIEEPALYEDEMSIVKKVLEELGINFEELKKKKVLKIPVKSYAPQTPSGMIEIYSSRAIKRGLSPFPIYIPLRGKGLKLITPSHLMLISSQYHNTYGYEDLFVYLNPVDAEGRGISDGDLVRVFNEYGEIKTRARVSGDVQQGVALIYKAFWPSKLGWNANYLTPDKGNKGYGNCTILHTVWVEVEKI